MPVNISSLSTSTSTSTSHVNSDIHHVNSSSCHVHISSIFKSSSSVDTSPVDVSFSHERTSSHVNSSSTISAPLHINVSSCHIILSRHRTYISDARRSVSRSPNINCTPDAINESPVTITIYPVEESPLANIIYGTGISGTSSSLHRKLGSPRSVIPVIIICSSPLMYKYARHHEIPIGESADKNETTHHVCMSPVKEKIALSSESACTNS